jgi:hypothetical protein
LPPCGVRGRLGVLELEALGRLVDERCLVAQGLQQAQDAVAVLGRAQQHRHDQSILHLLDEVGEHLLARRLHVGQKLLHELVVVVGKLLQHLEARFRLALLDRRGHVDDLGVGLRAIDEGALQCQVDEARGHAVLPDRDLAQHERLGARGLQHGEDVAHLGVEGIDLVEEQEAGNAPVLELLEDELQRRNALGIGLAHHDGGIACGQRQRALVLELDGARAIDESELVVEKGGVGDVELDAHAVVAGLGRGVAHGVLVGYLALARDGAGARQDRFQQGRLAGQVRPDQCDAAGAAGGRATILPHEFLRDALRQWEAASSRAPAPELHGARDIIVNPRRNERKHQRHISLFDQLTRIDEGLCAHIACTRARRRWRTSGIISDAARDR